MKVIDGYKLQRVLGSGGMATVHLAESPGGGLVALKLLKAQGAGTSELARFEREVDVLEQLDHPNIVALKGSGDVDGAPYMAQEYVPGWDMKRLLKRGRPSQHFVLNMAIALADALGAAHAEQILHRDVKPENIWIDEHGTPKLLDFGLAAIPSSNLTGMGSSLGTMIYCSPEQIKGHTVDCRTDIFGLGTVVYQTLTGRPPFQTRESLADPLTQATAVIQNELTLPSTHDAGLKSWDSICIAMLEKNRDKRIATTEELKSALEALREELLAENVVRITDDSSPEIWSRHRLRGYETHVFSKGNIRIKVDGRELADGDTEGRIIIFHTNGDSRFYVFNRGVKEPSVEVGGDNLSSGKGVEWPIGTSLKINGYTFSLAAEGVIVSDEDLDTFSGELDNLLPDLSPDETTTRDA